MSHNATITTFGYPGRLIAEYDNWVVLLHPKQMTLGALVVACRSTATSLGDLPASVWAEYAAVTHDVERVLHQCFSAQKFNYLALMMVDPHVHFHVVPRYSSQVTFDGQTFTDDGWPALPPMGATHELTAERTGLLIATLRDAWGGSDTVAQ